MFMMNIPRQEDAFSSYKMIHAINSNGEINRMRSTVTTSEASMIEIYYPTAEQIDSLIQ